jgi:5-methylcytosine-specific restriction enzyme subunit McrC
VIEIHLREGGPSLVEAMDESVVKRLVGAGVVTATPLGAGRWDLRACQKVGVVRIGEVMLWVKPKLTVARLLWLLGWARRALFEAPGPVSLEASEDLVPALAEAFCAQAERALRQGLLQGYREIEGSESVLRGRLRTGDQLRHRFGLAVPLLISYDDFLADIAENQILKAATSRLLVLDGVGANVRARLRRLRGLLIDVSDIPPRSSLPVWRPTRLNSRYHDALGLAQLVLSGGSLEQEPGQLRLDGFLVDLSKVFETFVAENLGASLEKLSGRCQAQDPYTLDEQATIDIRPDLVWRIGGNPVAVIDAKYKAEKPSGFPQADLYQALAYATAYRLDDAHLVYAHGNEIAQQWTVRHAGIRIVAHTLDLDMPPADIFGQVDELASRIARSAGVRSDFEVGTASA